MFILLSLSEALFRILYRATHGCHGLFHCQAITVNDDISILPVQWLPGGIHILDRLTIVQENTPGGNIPDPGEHHLKADPEIDYSSVSLEMLHCIFVLQGAAAGGDETVFCFQILQDIGFYLREVIGSPGVQDLLQAAAFLLLDQQVGIKEALTACLGSQDTAGAFPTAGHTDQYDVAFLSISFHLVLPFDAVSAPVPNPMSRTTAKGLSMTFR